MNSTTCSTLQARIFLPSSEQDWERAQTDWQEEGRLELGAAEGGGDTAASSAEEESLFCLLAGDSVRSSGGWWGGLRPGWAGRSLSWPLIMLSRAWAWLGSIRPGGRRPGGKPGAAPAGCPRKPGRNWKGEAGGAWGASTAFTASCREEGGKRKGGKPRGMPGGRESRFLLDLGSAGTSVLLDLNKSNRKYFSFSAGNGRYELTLCSLCCIWLPGSS